MYEIKDVVYDLKAAFKRRRVLLFVTPILFLVAAIISLRYIEPKYRSNTTILVQSEQILNPLVMYDIAENMASNRNRLESLNEIIYSRSTMEILIDSLKLDRNIANEASKQALISSTQRNIGTSSRASDSFEISFTDSDPVLARDGAQLLANHFINTKLRLETRRHDETVLFFTNKLIELEAIVNEQRNQAVESTSVRLRDLPDNAETLQSRLQAIDASLGGIEWQIINEEEKLRFVELFQNEPDFPEAVNHLYKLPLDEIQYGDELAAALDEYDVIQQQFTENYPMLLNQSARVKQIANRIPPGIQLTLDRLYSTKAEMQAQKEVIVDNMQRFFVANQQANTQQSAVSIYEQLYSDMKVKLEQAKMTRDIGQKAADQFIVLDVANIPQEPVSPNKTLILAIGLFLGLVTGTGSAILAEVMDTTIRSEKDIPVQKPIIAYLTNG
ncbi:MAG: GNVR domain-containing protein [Balneolaceae bacterium]